MKVLQGFQCQEGSAFQLTWCLVTERLEGVLNRGVWMLQAKVLM